MPKRALVTAVSRSTSSKMMWGDFPPSSSVTVFRLVADICTISRPVTYSPVKAILSTPGCEARAAPAVGPNPGTTLSTPSGSPASAVRRASSRLVIGVCSAGCRTTVVPHARAGAAFQVAMRRAAELGGVRLEQVGDLVEDAGTLASGRGGPRALVGGARGRHGRIDVRLVALGDDRDHGAVVRADALEPLARAAVDELPVDEELIPPCAALGAEGLGAACHARPPSERPT